jgi:hypothetical protein
MPVGLRARPQHTPEVLAQIADRAEAALASLVEPTGI